LLAPWPTLLANLRAFQPEVLIAPASALGLLARDGGIAPGQVVSVAETLHDDEATAIRSAFGTAPMQVYQATEGTLALPCAHGRLHLNEAFLHIEPDWIDRPSRRFAPIVTDLSRRAQPVVRYRLDDILTMSETRCSCGAASRVIERIEGRCDDICQFLTSEGRPVPVFPDFIVRAILAADPGLSVFCAIQDRPGQIRIALPDRPVSDRIGPAIAMLAARLGAVPPEIDFSTYMPTSPKRRRVICRHPRNTTG
jgi:putative adenylate-forming enzyme